MNIATVLSTGHSYNLVDLHLNNVWFSSNGTARNCSVHINFVWQSFKIPARYFGNTMVSSVMAGMGFVGIIVI
jgi:hypothetical protein